MAPGEKETSLSRDPDAQDRGRSLISRRRGQEKIEGVGLEMKEKQMILNSAFLSKLKDQIPEEQAIEALLDHGITHYTFCPWDFHTHVQLYAEAKKVVHDPTLARRVTNYFIDVVADTYCVKKRDTDIPELRRSLTKGKMDQVIASLYQKIWGIDLGLPGSSSRGEHEEDSSAAGPDSLSRSFQMA